MKIPQLLFFVFFTVLISSNVDSDNDGYSDAEELSFGSNPKSASSFIYAGGWPYNPNKDNLNKNGFEANCPGDITCECNTDADCHNQFCKRYPRGSYCSPKETTKLPRFKMIDQFGDMVDIYDFSGDKEYVLLELSAAWCSPCNMLSAWLTFDDPEIKNQSWWKSEYSKIRDYINNGDVTLINVQYEDQFRDNAHADSVQDWFSQYPHDIIPILADEGKHLHKWVKPTGIPTVLLLNDKLEIIQPSSRGLNAALDKLLQLRTEK